MPFDTDAGSETGEEILNGDQDGAVVRRRWERLPIAVPIFVRGLDENGKNFIEFSAATNLNAGGMLLISRRRFSPGKKVSLEIPSPSPQLNPPSQESCNTFSAIVLYSEFTDGFHQCGVQFLEPILPDPDA